MLALRPRCYLYAEHLSLPISFMPFPRLLRQTGWFVLRRLRFRAAGDMSGAGIAFQNPFKTGPHPFRGPVLRILSRGREALQCRAKRSVRLWSVARHVTWSGSIPLFWLEVQRKDLGAISLL